MTSLQARMTQGNVVSWLTGILLGLILGVALLIVTNAGAPSAKTDTEGGAAVTQEASVNEAAQNGNTPETAGVTQGAQGGVSDSSTGGSQETAATVGNTASGEGEETAAPSAPGEGAGSGTATQDQGEAASGAAASGEAASGAAAGGSEQATEQAQGDAAAGQTLFAGSCGGCHGAQGQGGIGPAMTKEANTWDLTGFAQVLREGVTPDGRELAPTMPRFSEQQLSDQDVANIHAWVQGL